MSDTSPVVAPAAPATKSHWQQFEAELTKALTPFRNFVHKLTGEPVAAFSVKKIRKDANVVTLIPQDPHHDPVTVPYATAAKLDLQPGQWLIVPRVGNVTKLEDGAFNDLHEAVQYAPPEGAPFAHEDDNEHALKMARGIPPVNLATGNVAPPVDNAHVADGCEQFAPRMRCKMLVTGVDAYSPPNGGGVTTSESYSMTCVGGDKVQTGYPPDGTDEDNDFAKWSPSGSFSLSCNNPALFGKIKVGEKYYVDFTLANAAPIDVVPAPEIPAPVVIAPASPESPVPSEFPPTAPVNDVPLTIPPEVVAQDAPALGEQSAPEVPKEMLAAEPDK